MMMIIIIIIAIENRCMNCKVRKNEKVREVIMMIQCSAYGGIIASSRGTRG